MMEKVNTECHTLGNHECSGALVGIWPNRTFDTVRDKIMQLGGQSPQAAQQLTEDLVVTHIKYSLRMMKVWNNVVKEWKKPLTEEEVDIVTKLHKGNTSIEAIANFTRITMAWEGKWATSINSLSNKNVPTCAEDIALDEAGFKKDIPAMTLWENRATWSLQDLSAWKSRSRQIEGFLQKPASLAKLELYGRGQHLRKKWQDLLEMCEWDELLLEVEKQAAEKGGLKWGNLVAMAINIHPEGEEEEGDKYQRQKRKLGMDMDTRVTKKQKQDKKGMKIGRTEGKESDNEQTKILRPSKTQELINQMKEKEENSQIKQTKEKGKQKQGDEQEGPAKLPPPYTPNTFAPSINPPQRRPGPAPALPDG